MKKQLTYFLMGMIITTLIGCTPKSTSESESDKLMKVLIGTYTGKGSEGIYQAEMNPETGVLSGLKLMARVASPSYLSIGSVGRVYSVGESDSGTLYAFKWNNEADTLELINSVSSGGVHPCYVDVNPSSGLVAVANYSSGTASFYQVDATGALQKDPVISQHEGSGPDTTRQEGPHAHCSVFSPDGSYVYVVDLGIDQVMGYPVMDNEVSDGFVAIQMQPGDGPRHLVFHPEKPMAFIINELSNTVVSVEIDPKTGQMKEISRSATLPADFTDFSKCADIHISPDGRYLYASNRGHNSIAIFSVGSAGELNRIALEPVRGEWPRNFVLSPEGKYLLVANRNTNNIVVFNRDQETGLLKFSGHELAVDEPVCLKFK